MSKDDNMKKENLKDIADILKSVPVYQDVVQPAAKELGQALSTVAKTINIALTPIKLMVWGYDQIEEFLINKLTEKLKNIPEENIITPPTYLAGPAIEALRFSGSTDELRELYANLLATAMDKKTADKAHPGYVDIIKSLTPHEARLLKIFFSELTYFPLINIYADEDTGHNLLLSNYTLLNEKLGIGNEFLICGYITNLCRLGILEIPAGEFLADLKRYDSLENSEVVSLVKKEIETRGKRTKIEKRFLRLTPFGNDFVKCVVKTD